jgi:peptidoglycan/LPS O-acetylase OafA/YrhL
VLLTLLVFSEASYRLVEIPGIRSGQRINARIRARQNASK